MKYRICKCCNRELPETTEYFNKYWSKNNKFEPGELYHTVCKQCEFDKEYNDNWKNGLLKCKCCNNYFPEEIFHKQGKSIIRHGRDSRCPQCKAKQNKIAREKYDDKTKLEKVLLSRFLGAQDRAKRQNIEFNITKEDIENLWNLQNGLCAISDIPMTYELDKGRIFTNVSIDKINPNLGYTKDNIQLVCMAVNQMKSDMSLQELYMFCEAIIKKKKK